jgi:glutathione S-transferase
MKLYYSPGACSLSPHIVLREAGLPFTLEKTDIKKKKTADGGDYYAINSKGAVPALQLDDGRVLTEGPAIVQYIADQQPDSGLAPRWGTFERYQLMEILNFIGSELHAGFHPVFAPNASPETKAAAIESLGKRFDWLSKRIVAGKYLLGDAFTVADAYLFTILRWTDYAKMDRGKWPALAAYFELAGARPKVQEALKTEGLIRKS